MQFARAALGRDGGAFFLGARGCAAEGGVRCCAVVGGERVGAAGIGRGGPIVRRGERVYVAGWDEAGCGWGTDG